VRTFQEKDVKTAEIVQSGGAQLVKLPKESHVEGDTVVIRHEGNAIILEPLKPTAWPPGFFERIHIEDPAFERPPQGPVPPAPNLG